MKNRLAFYGLVLTLFYIFSFTHSYGTMTTFKILTPTLLTPENNEEIPALVSMLTWTPIPTADKYLVQLSYDKSFQTILYSAIVTSNNLKFLASDYSTNYYWRVKGYNAIDSSAYSLTYVFTTLDTSNNINKYNCNKIQLIPNSSALSSQNSFFDNYHNLIIFGKYQNYIELTDDFKIIDKYYDARYYSENSFIAVFDSLSKVRYALSLRGSNVVVKGAVSDNEGNCFLAGSYSSSVVSFTDSIYFRQRLSQWKYTYSDGLIFKLDKYGKLVWVTDLGGFDFDYVNNIALDKTGNIWVTVSSKSDEIDFGNGINNKNETKYPNYLVKYDKYGKCQFAKGLANTQNFLIDKSDNFIFVGELLTDSISLLGNKINVPGDKAKKGFVAKFDSKFNPVWAKRINYYNDFDSYNRVSSPLNLCVSSKNDILFSACYNSNSIEDSFPLNYYGVGKEFYLGMLDSNGKYKWIKNLSGINDEVITSLHIDKNDQIYLTCNFNSDSLQLNDNIILRKAVNQTNNQTNAFIASFDKNGNFIKFLKTSGINANKLFALDVSENGNISVFGESFSPIIGFGYNAGIKTNYSKNCFFAEIGDRKLPAAPVLKFPENASEIYSENLTISWSRTSNAINYEYLLANDDKFQNVIFTGITDCIIVPVEQKITPGVYYWKVRANNELGNSDWSSIGSFKIIETNKNSMLYCLSSKYFALDTLSISCGKFDDYGNYYIAGTLTMPFIKLTDSISLKKTKKATEFIIKFNKLGICQWAREIESSRNVTIHEIGINPKGEVFIIGEYSDSLFSDGNLKAYKDSWKDVFYIKYDSLGNSKYVKRYTAGIIINGCSITPDPFGNLYINGFYDSDKIEFAPGLTVVNKIRPSANYRVSSYCAKFNEAGDCIECYPVSDTSFVPTSKIKFDKAGNRYYLGSFNTGNYILNQNFEMKKNNNDKEVLYLVKYDTLGRFQWSKTISSTQRFLNYNYDLDADGGASIIGVSNYACVLDFGLGQVLKSHDANDLFAVRYDASGNLIKYKFIANIDFYNVNNNNYSKLNEEIKSIAYGEFYLIGTNQEPTVNLGNNKFLYPVSSVDTYIVNFDSSFICKNLKFIRGEKSDNIIAYKIDDDRNIYIIGNTYSPYLNLADSYNKISNRDTTQFVYWAKLGLQRNIDSPNLISPVHNQILKETRPDFKWNKVNLATGYEIEFSTDLRFRTIMEPAKTGDTSFKYFNEFAKNTLYFWRIRAFNAKDTSERSDIRAFYIDDNSEVCETLEKDLKIFPNPSSGILKYEVNQRNENLISIKIIDITGNVVLYLSNLTDKISGELDLSGLSIGNYSAVFETTKRNIAKKFVLLK